MALPCAHVQGLTHSRGSRTWGSCAWGRRAWGSYAWGTAHLRQFRPPVDNIPASARTPEKTALSARALRAFVSKSQTHDQSQLRFCPSPPSVVKHLRLFSRATVHSLGFHPKGGHSLTPNHALEGFPSINNLTLDEKLASARRQFAASRQFAAGKRLTTTSCNAAAPAPAALAGFGQRTPRCFEPPNPSRRP